ncbi:transcriptional adapter 2-alpha [Anaeramoeba flamelloides]|uniref:Transcriptional adapter 2-alpha n=1 Tax=Anaeramoeba flamelloides TaxID=1746091 RepID=A0AAV8A8E6_9EUKA|nr:transcriptional adapter 2-alpha [Anaeramoeba flamelloides]
MEEDELNPKVYCKNCHLDLTKYVIVKCSICDNVVLCPKCFSKGIKMKDHKPNHSYQVFASNYSPVYQKKWNLNDEIKLLEGLNEEGFGNWKEVSKHFRRKTKEECKEHYERVYLENKTSPFPSETKILSKFKKHSTKRNKKYAKKQHKQKRREKKNQKPKSDDEASLTMPQSLNREGKKNFTQVTGYNPLRKDFEIEYDNECETITSSIGFSDQQIPWNLKYKVLQGYNERIEERQRRNNFVINMGFLDSQNPIKKKKRMNQKVKSKNKEKTKNKNKNKNKNKKKKKKKKKKKEKSKEPEIEKTEQPLKDFKKQMKAFSRCFDNKKEFIKVRDSLTEEFKLKYEICKILQKKKFI